MFRTIAESVGLDAPHAQAWWTALAKAQWSAARSWLADLTYFDQQPRPGLAKLDAVPGFLHRVSPPSRVIGVLESLAQEQRLTRQEASAIEDHVLQCVNAQGQWFWSP
jgi:hypothetical protein